MGIDPNASLGQEETKIKPSHAINTWHSRKEWYLLALACVKTDKCRWTRNLVQCQIVCKCDIALQWTPLTVQSFTLRCTGEWQQQVKMFGVSHDVLLRLDSLRQLIGHNKCAVRYRIGSSGVATGSTRCAIGGRNRIMLASFMGLVKCLPHLVGSLRILPKKRITRVPAVQFATGK